MVKTLKIGDHEYDVSKLSGSSKEVLDSLTFTDSRINELSGMLALLRQAQKGYIDNLKSEMIASKAGLLPDLE